MKIKDLIVVVFLTSILLSCSKKEIKQTEIVEKSLESQVLAAYEEGMRALNENDVIYAAKKFNEAEILFPQSSWAPKSALMASYSYYKQDYYGDAIAELKRFLKYIQNIKIYPMHIIYCDVLL